MASVPTRRVRHGVKTVLVGCGNVSHRFLVVLANRDLLLTRKIWGLSWRERGFSGVSSQYAVLW